MSHLKRIRTWIVVAVFAVVGLSVTGFLELGGTAGAASDATFIIAPASGSYAVGATFNVAVSENSSVGDNTNATQMNLSFPTSLTWNSTTLTGPFTLCAQNSHTTTSVSVACGSTTAESGTQAIATVSFTVASAGSAPVAIAAGSDIDNTSGSSVFSGVHPSVTYTLTAPSGGGSPTPASTPTPVPSGKTTTTSSTKSATPTPAGSASPTPSVSATPSPSPSTASISSTGNGSSNGSLSVTVKNSAGNRVSGATVSLDDRTATTDSDGVANFAGVISGDHTLTIKAPGEKTLTADVSIGSGENKLVSYTLSKAVGLPWLPVTIVVVVLAGAGGATVWYLKFLHQPTPFTNLDYSPAASSPTVSATPAAPSPPVVDGIPPVQAQPQPAYRQPDQSYIDGPGGSQF